MAIGMHMIAATGVKGQSLSEVSITLNTEASVFESLKKIEKQTAFKFGYNKELPELREKVILNFEQEPLRNVLVFLAKETGIRFKRINKLISVTSKADQPADEVIEYSEQVVTGKVLDGDSDLGLPGVTVRVKYYENIGTITDANGDFTINVPDEAKILLITSVGYVSQEVAINGQTQLTVRLMPDQTILEDVVVVGYGDQERAYVTNSISQIKSEAFRNIPVSSVEQGIASQLPGVEVVQNSGRPGQAAQINIRGISTITAGTSPLIVVDGLPLSESSSLNVINPNDIASIEVLKDAAAAAIYGSRGANGVILITTKKNTGTAKTQFSFNAYTGFQQAASEIDFMKAYEHARFSRDARNNYYMQFSDGTFSVTDDNATRRANAKARRFNARKAIIPSYIQPYLEEKQGLTDTDWQNELFRKARISNYQLSAAGGNKKLSYYTSADVFTQEGIVVGTDFQRLSFRTNLDAQLTKKLKLGLNFSPSFITENVIPEGFSDGPINALIGSLPYFPVRNADGSLAISKQVTGATEGDQARFENPVAMATFNKDRRRKRQLLAGTYLKLELAKGLVAKSYLGTDFTSFRRDTFYPSAIGQRNVKAPRIARGSSSSSERLNWIVENTLRYDKNFGADHKFDALLGYTWQEESHDFHSVSANNFPNDLVTTINAGVVNRGTSRASKWSLISYLARARYNFKGKLLLSAAIRRDGSSRFGADNRWGIFPSVSAGYIISEESFFPTSHFLSDLKIRASWGVAGNNQIGDYAAQALLSQTNAVLGGKIQSGLTTGTSPNTNLGWEETNTLDIGIDFGLFEGQLTGSLDYYVARTNNLLLQVPVPAHSGFTRSLQNIGKVENRGIELSLTAKYNLGPIEATTTFNVASNTNKVLALGPGQKEILSGGRNITRVGGELGASFGYKVLGIFNSEDEIKRIPSLKNAKVGDYIYADTNGDGKIDSKDRTVLGSIHPDYTYGMNTSLKYKGFDLAVVIQGVQGVRIHNRNRSVLLYNPEGWSNGSRKYFNNYYTPERGKSAIYARPNAVPRDNRYYRETDLLQDDASFFRVRNITLGYTVNNQLLGKAGLNSLRIYLSSKNPFTVTEFEGFNPEQRSGSVLSPTASWGAYPVDRSFVIGLNMNF